MDLWRISNYGSLSGEGGLAFAARWNSAGSRVVYLADSASTALMEVLVHLEVRRRQIPLEFLLLRIPVPEGVVIEEVALPARSNWKNDVAISQRLGDAWLQGQTAALARVPSVILPHAWNYLLNPAHPDAARIRIAEKSRFRVDERLLRIRDLS
jgi:RES domain-containing protein